jgi:peptidoglycan/LPS O-acetylase OafA/YrhL
MTTATARPPARTAPGEGLPHRPGLDGVRGLAVAAVLLFHAGVPWAAGGWLGVDAFFVLSGFLITSLLLAEHARTGRVAIRAFWFRRARRLLPAVVVVVAAVVAQAALTGESGVTRGLRDDALATLAYVENWRLLLADDGGYFTAGGPPSPLRHAWSLSVEEQFYAVWPVAVLLALGSSWGRRHLPAACAGGALASAAWAAALAASGAGVDRLHLGSDTRAQALLVGAAAAALVARGVRVPSALGAWGLAAATGTAAVLGLAGPGAAYRGGLLLFAVALAAVVVAASSRPGTLPARLLAREPLPALGRVSYSLYLWHWPVFLTLTGGATGLTGLPLLALRIGVSLALAAASYRLVEAPFRSGRWSSPARVAVTVPVAAAGVAVLAVAGAALAPVAPAAPVPPLVPAVVAAAPPAPVQGPVLPADAPRAPGPPRVLVVGDSVARTLAQALPPADGVELHNGGVLGCGLLEAGRYRYAGQVATTPPQCVDTPARWAAAARQVDADVVSVLVGRWEVMDRELPDGRWTSVGDPAYEADLRRRLVSALRAVAATGARPVLLTAPYSRRTERPDGGLWPEDTAERVDRWNAVVRAAAADVRPPVPVIGLGARMGARRTVRRAGGGGAAPVRRAAHHDRRRGLARPLAAAAARGGRVGAPARRSSAGAARRGRCAPGAAPRGCLDRNARPLRHLPSGEHPARGGTPGPTRAQGAP